MHPFVSFSRYITCLLCMASMVLVNCSVLCQTDNRLIFPWKILSIGASGHTVQQFFEEFMLTDLKSNETGMELGKSKDSIDVVELSVPLDMAVQSFGCFMRYHVNSSRGASFHAVDAFKLMMFSQRQQLRKLPRRASSKPER